MIYAILALSLKLLVGGTGLVCFGHAAFFGIGAYVAVLISMRVDQAPVAWVLPASAGDSAPTRWSWGRCPCAPRGCTSSWSRWQSEAVFGAFAKHWNLGLGLTIIASVALLPRGLVGIPGQVRSRLAGRANAAAADRITVMVNGAVIAQDVPEAVRRNPDVQTAYLGGH